MKKNRLYLSGPMSGLPDLNFPAFNAEAQRLRDLGYEVINPVELNPDGGTWHECMRRDIAALMDCDKVVLLDGWEKSAGACLEKDIAARVGIPAGLAKELAG